MPISGDKFDREGRDPKAAWAEHMGKVLAIRFGGCEVLTTWEIALAFSADVPIAPSDYTEHDEDVVKQATRLALECEGWTITQLKWGKEQGVDIVAEQDDNHLVVEAKGGMKRRGPSMENYSMKAIGQIVFARKHDDWECALAFPALRGYVRLVQKVPAWFWEVTKMRVYLAKKKEGAYHLGEIHPGH